MEKRTDARSLLVAMLQEAAELEHSLLNSYLHAACSIKATPQEWADAAGQENRRRAPQFERARLWKAGILEVAHEEMRHLHFVQCLIRALGERPHFALPARDGTGSWTFGNWRTRIGAAPPDEGGTEVRVEPFGPAALRDFILYESTDALQDEDPFGPAATDLFERLQAFEFAVRTEGLLAGVAEGPAKDDLRRKISYLYLELPPVDAAQLKSFTAIPPERTLPLDQIRFQSIADLYRNGILPLYRQAFESGWVVANDRNLVDEQLDPNYAAEGFLPIGPVGRSMRFARFAQANEQNPLSDYKRVEDIVAEIVDEGEGASMFRPHAEAMLAKATEIGAGGFVAALAADGRGGPGYRTPDWLAQAQSVRKSHLYRFAVMAVELRQEERLCAEAGVPFAAAREPLEPTTAELRKLKAEVPAQFNAAYLGMLAWLARMYETRSWGADKPRRMAIEMLATWPLMSLAVRPMLELATLVGCETSDLFRYSDEDVPQLPVWAQELAALYSSPERSEEVNERMDRLVVRTLSGVASWAGQLADRMEATGPSRDGAALVLSRLRALTRLAEFERQFPYRTAGGYSDRQPDLTYINTHPGSDDLSEAPGLRPASAGKPLFEGCLVARLRFRGWGLVQLATDPDPPTDEVGVTGTHMLHPADGDRRFDRALVWQDRDPDLNIRRSHAPPLGVETCEIALMAPDRITGATAGYVPIGVMNSAGAVQTTGIQQTLAVEGLHLVDELDPATGVPGAGPLGIHLESKAGVRPFLNGENHLVWQDGEPVDPFILSVHDGAEAGGGRLLTREIHNAGLSVAQMEPYQRLLTSRGPCGFDSAANVPGWATTPEVQAILSAPGFPMSFLRRRAGVLADELGHMDGTGGWTRDEADGAISLVERIARVAQPRGTTIGWLTVLLHYGHTVSGTMAPAAAAQPLLDALGRRSGLKLEIASTQDRDAPNGRWLVSYTKGLMDTDTLSDFIYGELHIPLRVVGGTPSFRRSWTFAAGMADAVRGYALDFAKPFWAGFTVAGDTRSTQVGGLDPDDPGKTTTLTETLTERSADGYRYTVAPIGGVRQDGAFSLAPDGGGGVELTWSCSFTADDPADAERWLSLLAAAADDMGGALARHFAPGAATRRPTPGGTAGAVK